ncbi:MAG TPA: hypothetical protein VFA60_14160 [Terriglobales bacterium]|nr:hypothetical protein [Terriglobales bacterium]
MTVNDQGPISTAARRLIAIAFVIGGLLLPLTPLAASGAADKPACCKTACAMHARHHAHHGPQLKAQDRGCSHNCCVSTPSASSQVAPAAPAIATPEPPAEAIAAHAHAAPAQALRATPHLRGPPSLA